MSVAPHMSRSGYLKYLTTDRDFSLGFGPRNPLGEYSATHAPEDATVSFKILI